LAPVMESLSRLLLQSIGRCLLILIGQTRTGDEDALISKVSKFCRYWLLISDISG